MVDDDDASPQVRRRAAAHLPELGRFWLENAPEREEYGCIPDFEWDPADAAEVVGAAATRASGDGELAAQLEIAKQFLDEQADQVRSSNP